MTCRICGNDEDNETFLAPEMMFGYPETFPYIRCGICGCLQIETIPDDLEKYYGEDYYSYVPRDREKGLRRLLVRSRNSYAVWDRGLIGRVLHQRFPKVNLRFLHTLPMTQDTRFLDVGCGAGNLLYELRELGLHNLLGIDPFNDADITHDNGLTIRKTTIDEVDGTWDVILFNHSFEHLPDPSAVLARVGELLAPGGHCVIRVPISSSYAWDHYGVDWVQLDAPRHLYLHSVDSMQRLAEQADFESTDLAYDSTAFQFWGSEQIRAGITQLDARSYSKNPAASIFDKKQIAEFERRARELNETHRGDQATFYLRKRTG